MGEATAIASKTTVAAEAVLWTSLSVLAIYHQRWYAPYEGTELVVKLVIVKLGEETPGPQTIDGRL